ncbi:MAG: DUF362 domain-containing protein, partial [Bullifex sp.]
MSKVAIAKCGQYDGEKVYEALRLIASSSDFPAVEGKRVLLKPNVLSDSRPELGITTNPVVVEELIRLVKEKGAS